MHALIYTNSILVGLKEFEIRVREDIPYKIWTQNNLNWNFDRFSNFCVDSRCYVVYAFNWTIIETFLFSLDLPFETWISRVICTWQNDYVLSIMKWMHDNVFVYNSNLIKMR